ncbi:MAG: glycosyltransferase [Desulfovibrio sp.]|jgi:hypothetical protein|nr:glycosyltransferase [Desulfovibrio sp.]
MKKKSGKTSLLIVLVDALPLLANELRALGHEVVSLSPGGGIFSARALLGERKPDILVQMERLDARTYLADLEGLPCPTLFWGIDSQLNMFWQKWYARLFDGTLTPHLSLFRALPDFFRPRGLHAFSWPGHERPFVPHAARVRRLGICARVDEHRELRAALIALLGEQGLEHNSSPSLSGEEVLDFYSGTKTVPNESLVLELNYRLIEAASCGCLVLSQDVGADQEAILEPGPEFLVYRDGLELLDLVAFARKRPGTAEKIGFAAQRRIQAEHLPRMRAAKLLEIAAGATRRRLDGSAARMALWLTLAMQIRNRALPLDARAHALEGMNFFWGKDRDRSAQARPFLPHVCAQVINLLHEAGDRERSLELCRELLRIVSGDKGNEDRALIGQSSLMAASACALKQGLREAAPVFLDCRALMAGSPAPAGKERPDPAGICLAWARAAQESGDVFSPGFMFSPQSGTLPESALSWLLMAKALKAPGADARIAGLLRGRRELLFLRMAHTAMESLGHPQSFIAQLEYGLDCLQACRVREGLFEIAQALSKAGKTGQSAGFFARLRNSSPVGRNWEKILQESGIRES